MPPASFAAARVHNPPPAASTASGVRQAQVLAGRGVVRGEATAAILTELGADLSCALSRFVTMTGRGNSTRVVSIRTCRKTSQESYACVDIRSLETNKLLWGVQKSAIWA